MRRGVALAVLAGAALGLADGAALAQPVGPRPDLTIAAVTPSATRVAVGDTFEYLVTARNAGGAPCNWLNVSLTLPGEVSLVAARTTVPLSCATDRPVRIIGQPWVEACRGGPGFFLGAGRSVTIAWTVRAEREAAGAVATAAVDPGNRCLESREGNNSAAAAAVTLFRRPRLSLSVNRPGPASAGGPGVVPTQVFPVTVANIGEGPAIDVALAVVHARGPVPGPLPRYPELLGVYRGALLPEGQAQPAPLPGQCVDVETATEIARRCVFRLTLQPGERLQARYRFVACPRPGSAPAILSQIRADTADDEARAHSVSLHGACTL